jgi:hypothetical protein
LTVCPCARPGCAQAFLQLPSGRKRYCSLSCSAAARRLRQPRVCPVCQTVFAPAAAHVRAGQGQYCSSRCYGTARWGPRQLWRCRGCGRQEERKPSSAARPYCNRACYFAARGWRQRADHACPTCGTVRQVTPAALAQRRERFCRRACYIAWRRKPRTTRACAQCRKSMALLPCQWRRRFCSRPCWLKAHTPRRFRCHVCRQRFTAEAWREPQFCSRECAAQGRRGRHYQRAAELVARDQRIVALRADGLKAPQIRTRLQAEGCAWANGEKRATEAAIRQVLSRTRRPPPEQFVTLPTEGRRVAQNTRRT